MYWTFVMQKYFFEKFKESEEIVWNSPKDIKKGDIIFIYSTTPFKHIGSILKAISVPYRDNEDKLQVDVQKRIEIPKPIGLQELKDNPILSKWTPINKKSFIFQGSHHKMSNQEYNELKRLIVEENPDLKAQIEDLELGDLTIQVNKFKSTSEEILKDDRESYAEFIKLYPFKDHPEKIDALRKTDIYNPGHKPYFLYFIEFGLREFGNIRVGQALYAQNARDNIDKFKKLLKIAVNDSISLAEKVDAPWEEIKFFGGDKHIAKKIIFLYNQSEAFGIYKTEHLEHFASIIMEDYKYKSNKFDKNYDELTLGEKFEYLNNIILNFKNDIVKNDMDNVSFMHFLYHFYHPDDEGVPSDTVVWKIASGNLDKRIQMWPIFTEKGYIGVGWFGCESFLKMDYSKFNSIEELQKELLECTGKKSAHPNDEMIWNFAKEIQIGDYVVSNNGYNGILGVGIITSNYIGPKESEELNLDEKKEFFHYRKVDWLTTHEITIPGKKRFFQQQTIEKLNDKKWNEIKDLYIQIDPKYEDIFENNGDNDEKEAEDTEKLFLKPSNIKTNLKLDKNIIQQICATLNANKHIMLTGAPGTGKTDLAESISKSVHENGFSEGYVLTTATSDWTTYDTIGGYMPDKNGEVLKFEEGKFLQAIKENKWLIIDEINRADIDKAFGQLFTVLSGQGVELPYKINNKSIKIERTNDNKSYFDSETATYKVGNNWRILATMNVFDKDYLFEMSYAFMRRFTFIYVDLPLHEELTDLISEVWGTDLNDNYINSIVNLMKINEHRPIGPAIFKDMVEYVAEREKIKDPTENSSEVIIEDAIISFILPQFEGLELQKLKKIWKNVLIHYNHNNHLKSRLEDISGITFTNKLSEDNDESN